MKKIVTVKKQGSNLPIELDVSRIVAITGKRITEKSSEEEYETYYIYFENAVWAVQGESYEEVRKAWMELE